MAKQITKAEFDLEWNYEQLFKKDEFKLGEYFKNTGQSLFCRLDIRLTSIEEMKWACATISELNRKLNGLVESKSENVLRILAARQAVQSARYTLRYARIRDKVKPPKVTKSKKPGTTGSVLAVGEVGKLNKP